MIKLQQLLVNNKAIWIYINETVYMCMHACSVSKFITNVHIMHIHEENQYLETYYQYGAYTFWWDLHFYQNMWHNTGLQFSLIQYWYYCNFMKTQFSFFSRVLQMNIIAWAVDLQNLLHSCIYIHVIH